MQVTTQEPETMHDFLHKNMTNIAVTHRREDNRYYVWFTVKPLAVVKAADTIDQAVQELVAAYIDKYGKEL